MFISCTPVSIFADNLSISGDDMIEIDGSQETFEDLEEAEEVQENDSHLLFEEVNPEISETNEMTDITDLPKETESEAECVVDQK